MVSLGAFGEGGNIPNGGIGGASLWEAYRGIGGTPRIGGKLATMMTISVYHIDTRYTRARMFICYRIIYPVSSQLTCIYNHNFKNTNDLHQHNLYI